MANRLLETLQNIEDGRRQCVERLRANGYPISEEGSLKEVADMLKLVPAHEGKMFEYEGFDIGPYDVESDPDVWHRPTDWPDWISEVKKIGDTPLPGYDGIKCAPWWGGLIKKKGGTTTFRPWRDASDNSLTDQEDLIIVGNVKAPNSSYPKWYHSIMVILDDGTQYIFNSQDDADYVVEHHWPDDKEYHWFLVLIANRSYYNYGLTGNVCYNANIKEMVTFLYSSSVLENGQYEGLESLVINAPYTEQGKQQNPPVYSLTIRLHKKWPLNVIEDNPNPKIDGSYVERVRFQFSTCSLSRFETNNLETCAYNTFKIPYSLIYYKGPIFALNYGDYGLYYEGGIKSSYYLLKYADVDLEKQRTQVKGALVNFPYLQNSNEILKNIQELYTNTSAYNLIGSINIVCSKLDLSNLVNVSGGATGIQGRVDVADFSSLETVTNNLNFRDIYTKLFLLPKLKNITSDPRFNSPLYFLDLPNVETISNISSHFFNGTPAENCLLQCNLPKLKTLTAPQLFNKCRYLQRVILPENFKYSLDLSYNPLLTKGCLLDIIAKAAPLEESENYYIALSSSSKGKLTEEELAILIDKGWEVK